MTDTARQQSTDLESRDADDPIAENVGPSATRPWLIGRYAMYDEIASGGMATVHFGRLVGPAGFSRPVAIKRLRPQFARDPDFVKMFLDEARLAARINHPNVVPTLDVVDEGDQIVLVMEYVRGSTLAQLVRIARRRDEPVPTSVAVGIVTAVLYGLHAAHEARDDFGERLEIVHRDVSPQNVLVGCDGVARVLDFGIAKASGRLQTTRDGQLKGKLSYMAPEQVRNELVGPRTDVYAASVVLWEALTGRRLFYADSEVGTITRVLSEQVAPPSSIRPGLPASLDRVVVRGLQRDSSKRYETARLMALDLESCINASSHGEIADWVDKTAGNELRQQALRMADIERRAARAAASSPAPNILTARLAPLESGPRVSDAGALDVSDPLDPSPRSGVRGRKRAARAFALVSTVIAAGGLVFALRARHYGSGTTSDLPTVTSAIASAGAPAPSLATSTHTLTLPLAAPAPAAATTAPTTASAAATAGTAATPTASGAGASPTASAPLRGGPARPSTPAAATPASGPEHTAAGQSSPAATPTDKDCVPPYTADAKGHIHFKPNCL